MNRLLQTTAIYLTVVSFFLGMTSGESPGQTTIFDFDSGLGSEWSLIDVSGLFTVLTSGPNVQISKPADDRTVFPDGFITGGIGSNFCLAGDFVVTVDFELLDFPVTDVNQLNECILSVSGDDPEESFLVLRFSTNQQYVEVFSSSDGAIGAQINTQLTGRFRISRVGNTMSGYFADAGSEVFTLLGSAQWSSQDQIVSLIAVQGLQGGNLRAANSLDMTFDDLIVDGTIEPGCVTSASLALPWSALKSLYK